MLPGTISEMSFTTEYMSLNNNQRKAVDQIYGPVLVVAGPGTGKTQLLGMRVANILDKTDATPSNILCLTFTESGQQAMRERLTRFIGPASYEVTISTYHGFGNELLRRFPEYAGEALGQRPIDNLLLDEILRSVMESMPYSNPLRNADIYIEDMKSFISDAKRGLLSPEHIRQLANENLEFLKDANRLVQEHLGGLASITKQAIPMFAHLCKAMNTYSDRRSVLPPVRHLAGLVCESLQAAVDEAITSGKTVSVTAWKNQWLIKDSSNNFVIDGIKANNKLLAAADIYETYGRALMERGVFDYDDMILRAIRAMEENNDLRFTLQEQYQYILLDEFQDTNAMQFKLVELLTNNPVNEGRPNILAVGDDDQAIYAFQGASYSNMRRFLTMFNDVLVIPLTENYRSHHDILYVARKISSQIGERLHKDIEGINKELVAAGKKLPKSAIIERHELLSDVAELAWIAEEVSKLVKGGCDPKEIAILAPKHKYLEPLIPFLAAKNIPVHYEKRENVFDDPAVSQLIVMARLIRALCENDQESADALWPQVLSYSFWDLPTETIWQASWQAYEKRQPWQAQVLSDPALKTVGLFFIKLAQSANELTVEQMIDSLVGLSIVELAGHESPRYISPFYEHYFGKKTQQTRPLNFWQTLSHFTVLREALRQYKLDEDRTLRAQDLVEFADAHQRANIKLLSTTPYRDQSSAVQVMTAYKAKGLEFDTVFILGCQEEVWGSKARGNSSALGLPKNLQHIRYAGATEDERLRLFFVAITRARHRLYLTSHRGNYSGRVMTRLKYLLEYEDNNQVISKALPEIYGTVRQTRHDLPDTIEDLQYFWMARHFQFSGEANLHSLLSARLQNFQLSPSHVTAFTDLIYAGPDAMYLRSILRFPSAPQSDSSYGDAMHKTLQWLHLELVSKGELPNPKAATRHLAEVLKNKRLNEQVTSLLQDRGEIALRTYLSQRAGSFLKTDRHEVSFKNNGITVSEMRLTGTVDKLVVNEDEKTVKVVDFKTGKSYKAWKNNDAKLHAYRRQLYIYKMLVEKSRAFTGYKVSGGQLEFVEPDDDGQINTLELEFSAEEEIHITKLMQAVWRHIMKLSFPSTSNYSQTYKGIVAFEQDLIDDRI